LRAIAPVTAVRGNVDVLRDCDRYPDEAAVTLGGLRLHLVHQVAPLKARLAAGAWDGPPPDVLVYGHSHIGKAERVGGVLLFNPGSAGPRRFHTIPSVGRLTVRGAQVTAELFALDAVAVDQRTRSTQRELGVMTEKHLTPDRTRL